MENVLCLLLGLCLGAIAAYLSGYSRKKGENLATKEDIKELTAQTAVLTQTAKEIEATISDKMWDRQKRWELKRDQIFLVAQKSTAIRETLINLHGEFRRFDGYTLGRWRERMDAANLALDDLESAGLMAGLVCSSKLYDAVYSFVELARNIIVDMLKGNLRPLVDQLGEFATQYAAMHRTLREELAVAEE